MGALEPIGKLISSVPQRAQIQPQVNATQALALYKAWVGATLGPEAAEDVRPATLRGGAMHVFVRSSALLTELRLHEKEALRCLAAGNQTVLRINYAHEPH